jgi:hypothetical protein
MTTTIRVSGKTFYGGLDSLATDVPKECGWPEPVAQKWGKGQRFSYELTREQIEQMIEHLESLAEGFSYSDSPEALSEGRAFARDAARLRDALKTDTKEK